MSNNHYDTILENANQLTEYLMEKVCCDENDKMYVYLNETILMVIERMLRYREVYETFLYNTYRVEIDWKKYEASIYSTKDNTTVKFSLSC